VRRAYERAADAGISYIHLLPTWSEIEPSTNKYRWDAFDYRVKTAERFNLGLNLNFRVIDTNNRSGPYSRLGFNDQRHVDALIKVLRALGPRTKGRVRWVAIGNEVDAYLGSHPSEIADYAAMLQRVRPVIREQFPNALFTVNFQFGSIIGFERYRSITDLLDAYSFTYYPLNPDFTMQSPNVVFDDIRRMVEVVPNRPVIIQEIGYASSVALRSSNEQQARFVENAFEALKQHEGQVLAATFLFMSDLSKSTVDALAKYYKLPKNSNFKAYLETLGFFDSKARAKPAWDVFRREALALSNR
jgi:hypothetical protein